MTEVSELNQWQPAASWAPAVGPIRHRSDVRHGARRGARSDLETINRATFSEDGNIPNGSDDREPEAGPTRPRRPKATVRSAGSKGDGLFATTNIGPAGLIVAEQPFVEFDLPLRREAVSHALRSIDTESRDLFRSFGDARGEAGRAVDIAGSNLIPYEGEIRAGIFKMICRANHSCSPNARWVWKAEKQQMALYALRMIVKGQEITASYLDLDELLSDDRGSLIEEKYGFVCRCERCDGDDAAQWQSRQNRSDIAAAFERWETTPIDEWYASWMTASQNRTRTLRKMDQIMVLIKDEELTQLIPRLLEYRFMVHAAWGDLNSARRIAMKWEETERMVEKSGSPPAAHVTAIRRDPKKWAEWGKLGQNRQSFARTAKAKLVYPPIHVTQP